MLSRDLRRRTILNLCLATALVCVSPSLQGDEPAPSDPSGSQTPPATAASDDRPSGSSSAGAVLDRVTRHEIDLGQPLRNNPLGQKPSVILCPLAGGGYRLGWNDRKGKLHLSDLSADFVRQADDVKIPDVDLRGLTVDADGSSGLLVAQLPNRMWVMKLSSQGKLVYRTLLVGAKGRAAGGHFLDDHFSFTGRLASSEKEYAVHFAHSANTGAGGVHQGGFFARVDPRGKVLSKNDWSVSHSLDQRLLYHGDQWITLSAGDCYPKGLWFENRTAGKGLVVYPPPAEREAFGNCGGQVNATLGSLVSVGARVALVFVTRRDKSAEIWYMLLEEDGRAVASRQLTSTPDSQEQVVRLGVLGDKLLLLWRVAPPPGQAAANAVTKAAWLNPMGEFLSEPEELPYALPQNDDLVTLADGSLAWPDAPDGAKAIGIVRVRP